MKSSAFGLPASLLANMTTNEAYVSFKNYLDNILDAIAPEKNSVKIQPNNIIRSQWMTREHLKSSHTVQKLYRQRYNRMEGIQLK